MKDYNYTTMQIKKVKYRFIKSCVYLLFLFFYLNTSIAQTNDSYLDGLSKTSVSIKNEDGIIVKFKSYIATTNSERRRGLMYVKTLSEDESMLFHFKPPRYVSMWMKDTYIDLDIIFINKERKIIKIYENAKPLDTKSIKSDGQAEWVLEINGGLAQKNGFNIGNSVSF